MQDKFVCDTSVIFNGLILDLIENGELGEEPEILIPNIVIAEIVRSHGKHGLLPDNLNRECVKKFIHYTHEKYARKGLVAFPVYDTGYTHLFYKTTKKKHHVSCGHSFMEEIATQITYEADCQTCYKNKKGCFTKFKKVSKR